MKKVHNRQQVSWKLKKQIRKLFVQKIQMAEIVKETNLTERVIRRVIKEQGWEKMRERYYRLLCHISLSISIPLGSIAKQTGVNYYGLCRIRKKYNIPKAKRTAWNDRRSDQLEQEVINLYADGKTGKQITKKLGYKRKETAYQILEKHKIERREPKIQTYYDESFFEKIDTHEKAYVLGLIMTDGNVIKDYNGFEIQLTDGDGYILEKISDLIGASKSHPVQKINCDHKRKQEGTKNARDMMRLTVHSRKIAKDLKKLGVVKNKTKILRYNECVPDEFLSSFFRGLIDGDGSVGIDNRGYIWLTLTSASQKFIEDIKKIVPFKINQYRQKTAYDDIFILRGASRGEILKTLKWMYNNKGDFYLRRKYEKVQDQIC